MSSQRFCHHCGKQVQIGSNFCSSCGTSLSSLSSKPEPPKPREHKVTFAPRTLHEDDEEGEYIDHIEHLDIKQDGLQVEIIKDRTANETLGAALLAGSNMPPTPYERATPIKISDQQVLEDFRREGGSIRPDTKTIRPKAD